MRRLARPQTRTFLCHAVHGLPYSCSRTVLFFFLHALKCYPTPWRMEALWNSFRRTRLPASSTKNSIASVGKAVVGDVAMPRWLAAPGLIASLQAVVLLINATRRPRRSQSVDDGRAHPTHRLKSAAKGRHPLNVFADSSRVVAPIPPASPRARAGWRNCWRHRCSFRSSSAESGCEPSRSPRSIARYGFSMLFLRRSSNSPRFNFWCRPQQADIEVERVLS